MPIIVGIDPQPRVLAVHIRENNKTLHWFEHVLIKKSKTERVQDWQEHVYNNCEILWNKINKLTSAKIDLVCIEQQKGRVNIILEQTLFIIFLQKKINVYIVHPTVWKKKTNVLCTKNHRKNKLEVVKIVGPKLEQYATDNNITFQKTSIHDLCDAEKISEAGWHYLISKLPNENISEQQKCQIELSKDRNMQGY